MLRLALPVCLSLLLCTAPGLAEPRKQRAGKTPTAERKVERTVERFLNGSDADRNAMLKDVARAIADSGYRDVQTVPWLVMMARNTKGKDVMLLVDPVSLMAMEIDNGEPESASAQRPAAQLPETAIPGLRN